MSDDTGGRFGPFGALLSGVRFGKFVSVGVVGFAFDTVVLVALHLGLGLPELWAKVAGAETAILVMFLVNERWTFAGEGLAGRGPVLQRLLRSHLVRAGGTSVQIGVYWLLTSLVTVEVALGGVDWWFLLASPVAVGVAMLVNYAFESLFTWRVHREG